MRNIIADYQEISLIKPLLGLFRDIPPLDSLRVVTFDIETTGLNPATDRILSIGVKKFGDYYEFGTWDEYHTIKSFISLVHDIKDCVVTGHNIFNFDLPFIMQRAAIYGLRVPFEYRTSYSGERVKRNIRTAVFLYEHNQFYEIIWNDKSVSIVDTYILAGLHDAQYLFKEKSIKSLPVELGLRKEPRIDLEPAEIIKTWIERDPRHFEYLKYDVYDAEAVFKKLIVSFYYMQSFLDMNLQEIVISTSAKKVESFLKKYYYGNGYQRREPDFKISYPGAYTAARKGLYYNVMKADVASQYPYIMLAYRLGPGPVKDPDGIFHRLLLTMREKRIEFKRSGDPVKVDISGAMKIIINSAYGLLGADHHDFNNMKSAAGVTEYGRMIVKIMMTIIGSTGGQVIEVDTDGIMFTSPDKDIFNKMQLCMPKGMEIEHEVTCDWIYISGAKNYVYFAKGKLTKKGIFRKRNTMPFKNKFILEFLRLWTTEGTAAAAAYYNQCVLSVANGSIPLSEIRVTRKVAVSEKAALKYAKVGDQVADYYGYDEKQKKAKVISGPYNVKHYLKELNSWFVELFTNLTSNNKLEEGEANESED